MKKVTIGLAIVGVLILAGVLFFNRGSGPSQASGLAPADSVVFANVPNIPLTGFRWSRTALARIAAEPEVRAFLEKPLADFQARPPIEKNGKILSALKPGNIYFASTIESEEEGRVILGVQFWGKRMDFDNAVAELRSAFPEASGDTIREEYRGLEILVSQHGDLRLHTATAGRWGFLSNSDALIKDAIDRVTGNSRTPALASNPSFLKVIAELLSEPDLLVFLQPEKAVTALVAAGRSLNATAIPEHIDQLQGAEAVGAAWKIDGEMFRDAFYLLRPGTGAPESPLTHQAMALTTPATTVFLNFSLNFSHLANWVERMSAIHPQVAEILSPAARSLSQGYGPECAFLFDLSDATATPSLMLAIQTRNPDPNLFTSGSGGIPASAAQTIGSQPLHQIFTPYMPIAAAQNDRFLLFGTDAETLTQALEPHPKTLQDAPLFKASRGTYRLSNEAFCFIDTKTVFERAYGSLLPIVRMSAAMWPDLNNQIEVSKLPKPATIGQHLPPIVYSQNRSNDGTRLESSGPVSMSQFLLLLGGVGSLTNQGLLGN